MNIQLNINELKAATLCAGKKDIGYYLNGVLVHRINQTETVLVATNGHYMFICKADCDNMTSEHLGQLIIPNEAISQSFKTVDKKDKYIFLKYVSKDVYQLGNVVFTPINGKYPDYVRVIPQTFKPSIGYYNADYVAVCNKALKTIDGLDNAELVQNGENAAVMLKPFKHGKNMVYDRVMCVIMPMRGYGLTYSGFDLPKAELEKAA